MVDRDVLRHNTACTATVWWLYGNNSISHNQYPSFHITLECLICNNSWEYAKLKVSDSSGVLCLSYVLLIVCLPDRLTNFHQ